jgi:hypothetical protein
VWRTAGLRSRREDHLGDARAFEHVEARFHVGDLVLQLLELVAQRPALRRRLRIPDLRAARRGRD